LNSTPAPAGRYARRTRTLDERGKTEPLGAFYKKVSILHRIDGNRDRDAVFADISRLIEDKTAK